MVIVQRAALLFPARRAGSGAISSGRCCLWRIASLELRLVATHPDGKGGLAFLAEYPNAYSMFVFGMSAAHGDHRRAARVRQRTSPRSRSAISSRAGSRSCSRFSPFRCWRSRSRFRSSRNGRPQILGAQATRFHRAAERALLGRNVVANDAAEADPEHPVPDPSAQYAVSSKLSVFLHEPVGDCAARRRRRSSLRHRRRDQAALQGSVRAGQKAAGALAAAELTLLSRPARRPTSRRRPRARGRGRAAWSTIGRG